MISSELMPPAGGPDSPEHGGEEEIGARCDATQILMPPAPPFDDITPPRKKVYSGNESTCASDRMG
jgi:hypothetical protein